MATDDNLDLVISRHLRAPRALVWKAWTEPEHLKEWWCPKPWTTEVLGFELAPGGSFHTRMTGPNGETSDNPGSFLEIVPESRIVFTTALIANWRPAAEPWMPFTAFITLDDTAEGTRYVASVLHKDKATRDRHEQLGFFDGWGTCIDQLEAFAGSLN